MIRIISLFLIYWLDFCSIDEIISIFHAGMSSIIVLLLGDLLDPFFFLRKNPNRPTGMNAQHAREQERNHEDQVA